MSGPWLQKWMRASIGCTQEIQGFRADVNTRFETTVRWLVGLIFASWLTLMASIWVKIGN
jgi:hypothetical protein